MTKTVNFYGKYDDSKAHQFTHEIRYKVALNNWPALPGEPNGNNNTIMMIDPDKLNTMDEDAFTNALGSIFEHSDWIARQAYSDLPFENVDALHRSMVNVVKLSPEADQITLLRAHPELAGKEAQEGELTSSSTSEQSSAGLNSLNSEEMELVATLNADYLEKFGFPFIIAVRNHTKESIFTEWQLRLTNDRETELRTCLEQVYLIARIRLDSLINS